MKRSVEGVARETPTLAAALRRRARTDPDRWAYLFLQDGEEEAGRLTYAEVDRQARAVAAVLQASCAPGDRALLLFPPGLDFVAAFFGCLYAGVVAVPAYPPRSTRALPRLRAMLADSRPAVALTTAATLPRLRAWFEADPAIAPIPWRATDETAPGTEEAWRDPGFDPVSADPLAFLQYTSGSTADPKGVMVSNANLAHNQRLIQEACGHGPDSVFVSWLPVYHDLGLIGQVLQAVWVGAPCVLMAPVAFLQRPLRWLEAISRYRATTSGGPNFAWDLCVEKAAGADLSGIDLSSWQVAFNGAEPVRAETLARFAAVFGPHGFRAAAAYPCYGLAEATLMVSGGRPQEPPVVAAFSAAALEKGRAEAVRDDEAGRPLVGCGRVLGDQTVVIADPATAARLPAGRVGEVWVSGPSVARGYWERPEVTAETFGARLSGSPEEEKEGPFLRTGDLGFLDGGELSSEFFGELFITGRIKDLILLRGRNLYPQDIELTAERSHPDLRVGGVAAFVIEAGGEERLVVVQEVERRVRARAAAGTEIVDEIIVAIRGAVAEVFEAQVGEVVLVEPGGVPRTTSGKVQRRACRELYLSGGLPVVGRSAPAAPEGTSEEALPVATDAEDWLRSTFARLARIDPRRIDPEAPLTGLGLDSLVAIELRNAAAAEAGADLPLDELLDGMTLRSAAERLLAAGVGPASPPVPAVVATAESRVFPLSWNQRSLWFLHRLAPESAAYILAGAARIPGGIDPDLLRRSLQALVDRHPILRTTYHDGPDGPEQRVSAEVEAAFTAADATAWDEETLRAHLQELAFRPFDLERGPILRAGLFSRRADAVLVLAVHHIAADLWSLGVLLDELGQLLRGGGAAALSPLAAGYADHVRRQGERLAGPAGEELTAWWRETLAGAPPLDLPADRPRPPLQSFRGVSRSLRLAPETADRLATLGAQGGATLFMTLLAAFAVLLRRWSGQDDLVIGSPTAGRGQADLAGVVGYFVNPVPLRLDLTGDPSFITLLGRVRRAALAAFAHQDAPFPLLAERLGEEREPGRPPVFQAMLALEKERSAAAAGLAAFALGEPGVTLDLGGIRLESMALERRSAQLDLALTAAQHGGSLLIVLEAAADLFDAATAERLVAHLGALLTAIAESPDAPLSALPALPPADRQALLVDWNATETAVPGVCVHELVEAWADRQPEAIALAGDGEEISYGNLVRRARHLAAELRARGVGPERAVGLCLERSPALVVAALAALEAGGAYMPLNPAHPPERLTAMLRDAGAAVVVTRSELLELLPGLAETAAGGALLMPLDAERSSLDAEWSAQAEASSLLGGGGKAAELPSQSLAYVIYTSGSTGTPKGAELTHAGLVNLVLWNRETFGLGPGDRATQVAAPGFDAGVWEIWSALAAGATLLFPPGEVVASPPLLFAWLAEHRVTHCWLPTPLLDLALGEPRQPGPPLRWMFAGGDRMQRRPALDVPWRLGNLYGPTEATVITVASVVRPQAPENHQRTPSIGRPIANTRAYVVDGMLQPVPVGAVGELYLGGLGLGRGYRGRPDLTAQAFVPDPFGPPGSRLYRTGDLARHLPDGRIECLGRLDSQVKVRGVRVEPLEVEAALAALPGVREAAVLALPGPAGQRLAAFVVQGEGTGLDELRDRLHRTLPEAMVPSSFTLLAALPLTPNGKVDRRALALLPPSLPDAVSGLPRAAGGAPRTPAEELIAGLWAELLEVPQVGTDDSFFDLGGHSLLATRVTARLRGLFGVDLPLSALFAAPTVQGLAAAVARARSEGGELAEPPRPAPRTGPLPLSFAQERLWFLDRLAPGGTAYNIVGGLRFTGPLEAAALERAFTETARRHESLRTVFAGTAEGPVQVILPPAAVPLPRIDLAALPPAAREAEAERLATAEARRPFDLERGPLLRAGLVRLGADDHLLVLGLHHIIADGWSMGVLLGELAALYRAFLAGRPAALPEPPLQAADFAVWQRGQLRGGRLEALLAGWRGRLAGLPAALDLPLDRPRPPVQSFRGATARLRLPAPAATPLRTAARTQGASLFMLLLAAWQALLSRHGAGDDICVGSPVAGRGPRELQGLIGLFVNSLPLRGDLSDDPPFRILVERARAATLEAHARQDLPFERLVEELQPRRDLSRSPVFQTLLDVQPAVTPPLFPGLSCQIVEPDPGTTKLDLSLIAAEAADGGLDLSLQFATDLFDAATAAGMLAHLAALLAAAAAEPDRRVSELSLGDVSAVSAMTVTPALLPSPADGAPSPFLFDRIAARAAEAPTATALETDGARWTYAELAGRARELARHLRQIGVGPEVVVGVWADRSPEWLAGFLGVLEAGGVYLPLDPSHPRERLAFVLADAGVPVVLARREQAGEVPSGRHELLYLDGPSPPSPLENQEGGSSPSPGWGECGWERGAGGEGPVPLSPLSPDNAAYLIYTSGSTGRPKAVAVPHRALVDLAEESIRICAVGPGDRWLQASAPSFDASIFEIVTALGAGATLCLAPREEQLPGLALARVLRRMAVTHAMLTPAALAVTPEEDLPALAHLAAAAEACPPALAARWRSGRRLYNAYGPTEVTVCSTLGEVTEADTRSARVPIGNPLRHVGVHVVDRHLLPLPPGAPGEIALAGPAVARGYLGRPDLTAERFVPHPFSTVPGDRLYRTGDLARRLPDGRFDSLGRIDRQVKVRGVRIEPGEVESQLAGHPGVREAAVVARTVAGDRRLVAFFAPQGAPKTGALDARELREHLGRSLPEAMIPSLFVPLTELPRNAAGKLDRRALEEMPLDLPADGPPAGREPRTPTEERIAGVWAELLGRGRIGIDRIGIDEDFWDLGGHSLLAAHLIARLHDALGVELPVRSVFERPTIAGLAALAEEVRQAQGAETAPPTPSPAPRQGSPPLSFAQERLWFLDRLEPGNAAYNLPVAWRLDGPLDERMEQALAAALTEIARRHEPLRTRFPAPLGRPVQEIMPAGTAGSAGSGNLRTELPLARIDLTAPHPPTPSPIPSPRPGEDGRGDRGEGTAARLIREEAARPFDLETGPPVRAALFRLAAESRVLLVTMHHIVADGWSAAVLARELEALVPAVLARRPSPLPEPPLQYADWAVRQRDRLRGEALEARLLPWRQDLLGAPVLELPTGRPRPAAQTFRGRAVPAALSAERTAALRRLAQGAQGGTQVESATLFMAVLAAFAALLGRLAGQDEVVIGVPLANRGGAGTAGAVGLFANILPLRIRLAGDPPLRELLARVRERALAAFADQDLPFERLVEALEPQRDPSRPPLFQACLAMLEGTEADGGTAGLRLPGLRTAPFEVHTGTAKFDLTLGLTASADGGLRGGLEVNADLFDAATAERLVERFDRLLGGLLRGGAGVRLSELPLLDPAEERQIVAEGPSPNGMPLGTPVHRLFEEQAARHPERTALVAANGAELTFGALNARANRLARRLRDLGVGLETPVGVALERSPEMVLAFLAVLKAGGAYMPLDPGLPPARRDLLRAELSPVLEIDAEWLAATAAQEDADLPPLLPERLAGRALAYVLFTSGSTGRPKAVGVEHRSIVRLVRGGGFADLGPDETFLQLAPSSFDAATLEIWAPLANGGRLAFFPPGPASLDDLAAAIARHGVTTLWLTAGLFHQMVDARPQGLRPLRQLLAGGDVLAPAAVDRARAALTAGTVINGYGPTENTTFTCCHTVTGPVPSGSTVPIGRPIGATWTAVVDAALRPVPDGTPGELVTGGAGLARGYLGRPDLTAERFLPDPLTGGPGERLYRTGDRVRRRPDGAFEFLGRIDRQVKIRGFRVEPGEVEEALRQHPAVREAAVIVLGEGAGDRRLAAYASCHREVTEAELRRFLRERLPEPLVPAACVVLPALPLTPNGKIDRGALPAPPDTGSREGFIAPRTPAEELLAGLWTDVLGTERVSAGDDFFALGGHSLLAAQLAARVPAAFGVELPLLALFEAPTLSGMAARLEELRRGGTAPLPPLLPREREGDGRPPLSFGQERLWFLDRFEPGTATLNMPFALEMRGALIPGLLAGSLDGIVRRHEALRTTFHVSEEAAGRVWQEIGPAGPVPLPLLDLTALPEADREEEANRRMEAEATRPFDLADGPLLRAHLLRLEPERHRFLLTVHHIAFDGWSAWVLLRELGALYGGSPLPEPPVQYADYALWQRRWLAGSRREEQLAWWRERLGGERPALELPADRPRPAVQTYTGRAISRTLPSDLGAALHGLARREGATLFMVLLAAFDIVLQRLSGQDDLLVGTPVAGRGRVETEGLIGFFLNTLVLRADLAGDPPFRELLGRIRETALGAYAHQDVPFEAVLEDLQPERDLSRTPLFQVFFNLLNFPERRLHLPGLDLELRQTERAPAKLDLTVYISEGVSAEAAGLRFDLIYNSDLFDAARMTELLAQLAAVLGQTAARPEAPLSALSLATEAARAVLPDPTAPLDAGWIGAVHERIAEHARSAPERLARTAVIDRDGAWSYGDLLAASGRLGGRLQAHGVGKGDVVAVLAHRSAPLAPAVLGILEAGAAFTMLDPAYPPARLVEMVRLASPRACVHLEAAGPLPALLAAELDAAGCPCLPLPAGGGAAVLGRLAGPKVKAVPVGPDDLACLTFTSGSTGQPKGILGRHGPLSHFLPWMCGHFEMTEDDRFTMLSGLAHDPLQRDLFTPFWLGASLAIPDPDDFEHPGRLAAWMAEAGATVANLTPAMAQMMTERPAGTTPVRLDALRRVFLIGDILTRADVARIRELAPAALVINLYGSTETQRALSFHAVEPTGPISDQGEREERTRQVLPLGRGIPDVQLLVLDRAGRLAGIGEIGEIAIRSPHLARGYLGDPERTAERFPVNPFTGAPGDRLYRTGDLGRYEPDGNVTFAGRADFQVKIRGYRIELEEVAGALAAAPGVREAAVLAVEAGGEQRLVGYAVPAPGSTATAASLRTALAGRLPSYMVPAVLVLLERMPLTPNGKIDRRALARLAPEPETAAGEAPRTPTEEALAGLWADLLGVEAVGVHRSFFELGGHSLLATRLLARMRGAFGVDLPLRTLFERPTVAALAESIEEAQRGRPGETAAARPPLVPLTAAERAAGLPLSFAQERFWLLERMHPGDAAYHIPLAVRLRGRLDPPALAGALAAVARRHEILRTVYPLRDGRPVQTVRPPFPILLPLVELAELAPETREAEMRRLASAEARRPFDLSAGPVLRALLIRLGGDDHAVLLTLHHIASDGWSTGLLVAELAALYGGATFPEPPVQYADYAAWQRAWMRGEVLAAHRAFWRDALAGAPSAVALPWDRRPEGPRSRRGTEAVTALPADLATALRGRAREHGSTLFMVLLAALQAVLARWTGQRDLVTGTVAAERGQAAVEGLIGCFLNFLPLRARLTGGESFGALLDQARDIALAAHAHGECPFEEIAAAAGAPRDDVDGNPLYNVALLLQNVPRAHAFGAGLAAEPLPRESATALLDLRLVAEEIVAEDGEDGGLRLRWEHAAGLFDDATIAALASAFGSALERLAADPGAPAAAFPLPPELAAAEPALPPRTVAVAATFTAEPVESTLRFWLEELDLGAEVAFAPYGQLFQELLDPAGLFATNRDGVNVGLVRLEDWQGETARAAADLARAVRAFSAGGSRSAPLVLCLCPPSPRAAADPEAAAALARAEAGLATDLAGIPGVHVTTAAELAALYPVAAPHDPRAEALGHVPYTQAFFTALGTLVARRVWALLTPPSKVIALDCDQTLWQGVCGEDGPLGITLDPPRRFLQEFMLAQRDAGMLLCLCSKNNAADVEAVFAQRPDMPLRREHIAAARLDWEPKPRNLRALADELGLGLDSFVFVDDNPVECAAVEAEHPEVLTLLLPEEPEQIPAFLRNVWAFDHLRVTEEDRRRADLYRQNAERESLRESALTLEEFLEGLELEVEIAPPTVEQLARVAQLTQRTNQFNLTTIRRGEAEIADLLASGAREGLAVRVRDRFGDYGLVGAVLFSAAGSNTALDVDTFLLSCRVLGRRVEHRVVAALGEIALARGIDRIDLRFVSSERNRPAADFLAAIAGDLRFEGGPGDGSAVFRLPADRAAALARTETMDEAMAETMIEEVELG